MKNEATLTGDAEALSHLETAIKGGRHWYIALLEATGIWASPEETIPGRTYRYLVGGEAFDWLLLAGRLCDTVVGLVPVDEREALLFEGRAPISLGRDEFRRLVGGKYQQYLNYFYGVIVEEALVLAVHDEVRKERRVLGYYGDRETAGEVYRRIYGVTRPVLLGRFRRDKGLAPSESMSLSDLKEFTYWRFKYRLDHSDRTRAASDTKKGLKFLAAAGFTHPW